MLAGFVEVKPVPKKKWHGKKGRELFTQPKVIEVLYSVEKGGYNTGLTAEEEEKYGKQLGVNLSSSFNPAEPHPYWGTKTARIKLHQSTNVFDKNKAADYVKIANMKASRFVANSLAEFEAGNYPDATHYISDEEAEVVVKATKIQRMNTINGIIAKMSKDQKISMYQVLGGLTLKGRTDDFIDVKIDEIKNEKPEEFLLWAKRGSEEVTVRAQVLEAIQKNILTKEGTAVYYGSDIIGIDLDDAVRWFKDGQNPALKIRIIEMLNK
jgi:hypothetical protein